MRITLALLNARAMRCFPDLTSVVRAGAPLAAGLRQATDPDGCGDGMAAPNARRTVPAMPASAADREAVLDGPSLEGVEAEAAELVLRDLRTGPAQRPVGALDR